MYSRLVLPEQQLLSTIDGLEILDHDNLGTDVAILSSNSLRTVMSLSCKSSFDLFSCDM